MLHLTPIFAENSFFLNFTTMKEEKEGIYWEVILTFYQLISKPHSFEVIKIELFDIQSNSSTSASSHPNSHGDLITSVAK